MKILEADLKRSRAANREAFERLLATVRAETDATVAVIDCHCTSISRAIMRATAILCASITLANMFIVGAILFS